MMRQGKPANDVALYMPNSDAWAHFTPGRVSLMDTLRDRMGPDVIARILDAGYNLDFFDDQALTVMQNHYRIIILPNVQSIPRGNVEKARAVREERRDSGGRNRANSFDRARVECNRCRARRSSRDCDAASRNQFRTGRKQARRNAESRAETGSGFVPGRPRFRFRAS